jgi:hypothetical protein
MMVLCVVDGVEGGFGRDVAALLLLLLLLSGWQPVQYLCLFEMVGALPHVAHVLVETDETVPVDFAAVALTLPPPPLLFLSLSLLLSGWHLTQ